MGIIYSLISDATGEGYDLGKGPWWDEAFSLALRSPAPASAVAVFLTRDEPHCKFDGDYARDIASEMAAFAAARPDWRVINDASDDGESEANYKRVGSRYR